jgi:hypothetical protein
VRDKLQKNKAAVISAWEKSAGLLKFTPPELDYPGWRKKSGAEKEEGSKRRRRAGRKEIAFFCPGGGSN